MEKMKDFQHKKLTYELIGSAMKVHTQLGPALKEFFYHLALSDELKDFVRATNSTQTDLKIVADPDSSILVDANDQKMKGLVKYSSEGGGNISLKLRGFSRRVHTKKSKRRVDIDEAVIIEVGGKFGLKTRRERKNKYKNDGEDT